MYFFKCISIFFKPSHDFLMLQIGQFGCKGILQKFKRGMASYEKAVNTCIAFSLSKHDLQISGIKRQLESKTLLGMVNCRINLLLVWSFVNLTDMFPQ